MPQDTLTGRRRVITLLADQRAGGWMAIGSWTERLVHSPASVTQARPPEHRVVVEPEVTAPMRDGTVLAGMLWRPEAPGRYPVLVERGPHRPELRTGPAGEYYAARGYVVVGLNVRGCGASGGTFDGSVGSPAGDGHDAVEWAARQPWSNGRVGTLCGSISGYTAYQAVVEAPPHLGPVFVREASGFAGHPWSRPTGVVPLSIFQFVAADWTEHRLAGFGPELHVRAERMLRRFKASKVEERGERFVCDPADPARRAAVLGPTRVSARLPLVPHPLFAGLADFYNEVVARVAAGAGVPGNLQAQVGRTRVPVCHLGAWFDPNVSGVLSAFVAMREGAASSEARSGQRLVVGPWQHGPDHVGEDRVGALEFGPNARLDYHAFRVRWYDHHLRGWPTGLERDPAVWLYVIGPDAWLGCDAWPPPGAVETPWYLRSDHAAGALSPDPPRTAERPDAYAYDPRDPVPTLQGYLPFGVGLDQAPLEHRMLAYTSPPLERPLALIGPLRAVLHAASSAPDTDWIVRLTWVRPDDSSIVLSAGALRARFRDGPGQPTLLEPNRPTRYELHMLPLAIELPAGHRLRLTVTSSDFPGLARNLNTGGDVATERRPRRATNTVFHDRSRPSCVVLPVMA
jgi:uncharacterized protein